MKKEYILLPVLLFFAGTGLAAQNKDCSCFILKEEDARLSVEKIKIENNRVEILSDPGIISPVFSMGQGMNGDMVPKEKRGGMIIAQCRDNILKLRIRNKEGVEKALPDMDMQLLSTLNIRVNVKAGSGTEKAFLIEKYKDVKEDNGPVIDMFGGKLPVKAGDFIITTETKKATVSGSVSGQVQYKILEKWIVVPVVSPAGKKGNFVVDLAATSTVVDSQFIGNAVEIRKMEMIEYTDGKASGKPVSMQGATGKTGENILLGKALIPVLELEGLTIEAVEASVLKVFPEKLKKAGISGILGTDILMRAGSFRVQDLQQKKGQLTFGPDKCTGRSFFTLDFSVAGGLLFADGLIGKTPVKFLLDTGAGESVLSETLVKENNIACKLLDRNKIIAGIDGSPIKAKLIRVASLKLGGKTFPDQSLVLGNIAVLNAFGLEANTVILGMSFFSQFSGIGVDFTKKQFCLFI